MSAREQLARKISFLMGERPVRWADQRRFLGDYDGRDRTLEVFNADPLEQRDLVRRMRPLRHELEEVAEGPVVIIFHTRSESARLYSEFVTAHEETAPLRTLAQRVREVNTEAAIELVRIGDEEKLGLKVQRGDRRVVVEWDKLTGFDVWLVEEPFVDRDPDFRLSDGERALLSVSMLISQGSKGIALKGELALLPDRETANTNTSLEDPPSLNFKDQVVRKGTNQPPRKAA
jgi:hypothetical protein